MTRVRLSESSSGTCRLLFPSLRRVIFLMKEHAPTDVTVSERPAWESL